MLADTAAPGTKSELFATADFVSLHLALSPTTRRLIGAPELAVMKPGAVLINTSRGPICDEAAVARACEDGRLGWYAADTFEVEPLPPRHRFQHLANVMATPHIGYVTTENYRAYYADAADAVNAFLDGRPLRRVHAGEQPALPAE